MRRVFLEGFQKFAHVGLRRHQQIGAVQRSIEIGVGSDGGALVRITAQIEDQGTRSGTKGSIQTWKVPFGFLRLDEFDGPIQSFIVDCLHRFLVSGPVSSIF
jgi:hypothetical protein